MSRRLFVALLAAGALLRLAAAWAAWGVHHPDEHQQYLEQGYRLAFGFGETFWEQERGMRSPLLPAAVAGVLQCCATLGIDDPPARAAVVRFTLSLAVLLAAAAVARVHAARPIFAGTFLALVALTPDAIYISTRPLSETACLPPLMLGWAFATARPALAGAMFALAFAVRIQTAPIGLGFVLVAAVADRKAAWTMVCGGCVGLWLFAGVPEWAAYGSLFHAVKANITAQLLEGRAADWGESPWYAYFPATLRTMLGVSVVVPVLLVGGAIKEWKLTLPTALFVAVHCAIGHKEERFLWPAAPLAAGLVAVGVEYTVRRAAGVSRLFLLLLGATFLAGVPVRYLALPWNHPEYRGVAEGLRFVGRQPDATGVAVGIKKPEAGNYFFLNRNISLRHSPRPRDGGLLGPSPLPAPEPRVNYLVARPDQVPPGAERVADCYAGWGVYRAPP